MHTVVFTRSFFIKIMVHDVEPFSHLKYPIERCTWHLCLDALIVNFGRKGNTIGIPPSNLIKTFTNQVRTVVRRHELLTRSVPSCCRRRDVLTFT